MKRRISCLVLILLVFLAGCNLPRGGPVPGVGAVASLVAATLKAIPTLELPQVALPTLPSQLPVLTLLALPTPVNQTTPTPLPGSISGTIHGYPYGAIPALTVVAFDQTSPYLKYWYWKTAPGNTSYSMDSYIPPGLYQVVAYDAAGHAGGCLTQVNVLSDQMVQCDISDWTGNYPANPVH